MAIGVQQQPCLDGFRHRVAAHCATGALRDLLEHHRVSYSPEPLSEGAVFGLSGALDLHLRLDSAVELDGRAAALELELCRNLGLDAWWCETDDPSTGWQQLRSELDAGEPTLLRADAGELSYHDDSAHDTRHAIVATSCDVQAGVVWVADGRFADPQRCTLSSLAAARASDGWPEPARHALLRLRRPERLADPRAAAAAALTRVVQSMRRPERGAAPHARKGLAAIDALAAAWPWLPASAGPRLAEMFAALGFRVRDGSSGGTLYRSLQARFEHDAAALLGSAQLGRAALVCDDLADAWRAFAAALDDEDAARAHTVAQPWLERIRTLEHRHVEALEEHLGMRSAALA